MDQWKTIVINLQGKLTSKGEITAIGQKQQRKHALKLKKTKPKTKGKQHQQQHTIKTIKSAQNFVAPTENSKTKTATK